MSKGKTGQQTMAENLTNQRGYQMQNAQNQQSGAMGQQNQLTGQATGALGQAQGSLGQFEGPVQQSPFYKALLDTGISSTSGAYQNAQANMNQRANAAGFGYEQPINQGANAQLGAQEASALAQVPNTAMVEATRPELLAAGETAGIGRDYGQLGGQYGQEALGLGGEALGYGAQQLGANQQAANLQQQRNQATQGLWSALAAIPWGG